VQGVVCNPQNELRLGMPVTVDVSSLGPQAGPRGCEERM